MPNSPAPLEEELRQIQAAQSLNATAALRFAALGIGGALVANGLGAVSLLLTLGMMTADPHGPLPPAALMQLRTAMSYFAIGVAIAVATACLGYLSRSFSLHDYGLKVVPLQILGASTGLVSAILFCLGAISAADAFVALLGV